jgi:hypothetical protein
MQRPHGWGDLLCGGRQQDEGGDEQTSAAPISAAGAGERADEVAESHDNGPRRAMKSHRDGDVAATAADERTVA